MSPRELPSNPYVLLTPGPLSTTQTVKEVMLRDWCTWDVDYNTIVQAIRSRLVEIATSRFALSYTSVLMQGSGTFCMEATLGTAIPAEGKVLILANGAYGERMALIAERLKIPNTVLRSEETETPDPSRIREVLAKDPSLSHVALVHCETTTGILNPLEEIAEVVQESGRAFIVDAMSSFGGIPMDIGELGVDFLVSSANKCIQGVPGFGFVIARRSALEACEGRARSLSLDLYDQWRTMEKENGKWRFTSPTHVVRAFAQALQELDDEGGVAARNARYRGNHFDLLRGMSGLGFRCLLREDLQSPIITSFLDPPSPSYSFPWFYTKLKEKGFVIYPGKVSRASTFRIGTIGDINLITIHSLVDAIQDCMFWKSS
jgi:2-aminoethylphosphonate-pyruvate transaminase